MSKLFNFLGFQSLWFSAILGAAAGLPWLGPVVLVPLAGLHLWSCGEARAEVRLLFLAALLGYILDSILTVAGVLRFAEHTRLGGPSPLWMVTLWVGLAATLRSSLGWMRGRHLGALVFGALGGPIAYAAGARLGAVTVAPPVAGSMALVAVEWAVAMPILVFLAARPQPRPVSSVETTSL